MHTIGVVCSAQCPQLASLAPLPSPRPRCAAATASAAAARRDWLEALEAADLPALTSSPDAPHAAASISHSLLAAALVLLPAAPAANDAQQLPTPQQQGLQEVATQVLPRLLAACHRSQAPQLILVVSLATSLIDRLVAPAAWLPLLRAHLHFGNLLHSMLLSLHAAAQHAAAAQAAAPAGAPRSAAGPAAPAPAAPPLLLPPVPAAEVPVVAAAAAPDADAAQPAGLSPLAAASVEEAALLLALQVAQSRAGADLLLEQGAVAHALALG